MKGVLLRHVLFPAWHWARNDGVNHAIRELEKSQWLSTSELVEQQQRKLARLVSFASRNVPYYEQLMRNLDISGAEPQSIDDFRRIPPLTKDIVRRNAKTLVSRNLDGNRLKSNSTSGSTGEAMRFFTDARSLPYRKASLLRSDSWTGWRLGERTARIWGAPVDARIASSLRGRVHGWLTRDLFLSSFELSTNDMDRYVKAIENFKPVLLVAYPGPLEQFALHCRKRGIGFPSLRAIVSSAETLWPAQREVVEEAFGVRIFNRYGSREVAQVASECEAHEGLHISVERIFIEVVNEEGKLCAPNEVGRILVTELDNYGMPLIRYDIGDRGAMGDSRACSCGRGLPMLKTVEGRTMEIVRTLDGRRIGGTFWTLLLRSRPGLRQFQVIQKTLDGVQIKFVRDPEFDTAVLRYFTDRIKEYCGGDFRVEFVETASIDLTGSGKQRIIISDIRNDLAGK